MTTSTAPATRARNTGHATGAPRGAVPGGARASGKPRILWAPKAHSYELADEAVKLAAKAGLELDDWQAKILRASLGVRKDGKWAAFEVGASVPRQNGKGGVIEARELAGLFLFHEFPVKRSPAATSLIVHSAHQFDTSLEAFRRLLWLIEDTPELGSQIKRVSRSHGEEGIELMSGSRIRFRTRTKGGGRGFAADDLILDEAMFLPEHGYGALLPILSARPNPQVWYTGSAVDEEVHPDGVVFARVRERGIEESDPRLAYFEWSLPYERPEEVPESVFQDEKAWAKANPAMGIRIAAETVASELRALDARTFAVERLGVGSWPATDGAVHIIDMGLWAELTDYDSKPLDPVCFTFDTSPDRAKSSIAVAGKRSDGLIHVEIVKRAPGTGWVSEEIKRLAADHQCLEIICDSASPAASLLPELKALDIDVEKLDAREMAQACGHFYDLVDQRNLRHLGTTDMTSALKGAAKRPLGDAWAWSRKNSSFDISPLVASTLAVWGVNRTENITGGFEW